MNIGIPKERRPFEYRIGLSPSGVDILSEQGHTCFVEHEAGTGAGYTDQDFERAGARIVYSSEEVFGRADLVLKVARPMQEELEWMQPEATLAGLLHLASTRQDRINTLLEKKITSIAYEQIQLADGSLPVLRPLSEIGGLMTAQIAARLLQNNWGGKGILLGGIAGVPPAEVVILGAGVAGTKATKAFLGLGAHVTVLDHNMEALQKLYEQYPTIVTIYSSRRNIERSVAYADVVIGAVLIPGERTPVLIKRELVAKMKPRSVVIDLSIDQGGCFETSRPTSHDRSTYIEEGVIHFCVPNIPGVVGRAATHAFMNCAIPYISEIANEGVEKAISENPSLEKAVNTHKGELRHLVRLTSAEGSGYGLE
jgi:alanine dehydrogenase